MTHAARRVTMRHGLTLLELGVVTALLAIALLAGQFAAHALSRSERRADRESTRALLEAQVLEELLQDVRSSISITRPSDDEWRILRHVALARGIETREVVWRTDGLTRVTRHAAGEPARAWPLAGTGEATETVFRLKIERTDEDAPLP
jgi:type II secretory pathway pseudopilin PulG